MIGQAKSNSPRPARVDDHGIVYQCRMGGDAARPWVQEIAFGWCPGAEEREIVAAVNWSPAIVDPFRDIGSISLDGMRPDWHAGARQLVWMFAENVTGFFSILPEWARAETPIPAIDTGKPNVSDDEGVHNDR